jgi:4-hydroxy-3-methylbut-2-enyl diphosphate reductase
LRETGAEQGVDSYIIDTAGELDMNWLRNKTKIGISSGASVPRCIVEDLVDKIKEAYPDARSHIFEDTEKNIVFPLPAI